MRMIDALQRVSVTLLIQGDDLVPEELSAMLGTTAEIGVRKGETFKSRGRPGAIVTAATGMWHVGTGVREQPNIDEQIAELIDSLPEDAGTWHKLTTKFDCYVSVGAWFIDDSWTGGFALEPKTLGMLAARGLAVDFDIYAPEASN
jgi:hypothetical protein